MPYKSTNMNLNPFAAFELQDKNSLSTLIKYAQNNEVELPPIFKLFISTFKIESATPPEDHYLVHNDPELGFEGFEISISERIDVYADSPEFYQSKALLPFADSGIYSTGICVGFDISNADKILVEDEAGSGGLKVVATNIFEFIKALRFQRFNEV